MILTRDEIDAIALPRGTKPGKRPADMTQADLDAACPGMHSVEKWRAHDADLCRRMVDAAAARHGWTQAQRDAASSVYPHIPTNAIKGKSMYGSNTYDVLCAAAERAS